MSRKVTDFITEIAAHFPPRHADEGIAKAWTESMFRELSGYDPEVLTQAARNILRKRKADRYRAFPTLGECIAACDEALDWSRRSREPLLSVPSSGNDDWTAERLKLARELIRCDLGRQAAKDGWIHSLWGFCRKNQRLPAGAEIERCKKDAEEFDLAFEKAVRGVGPQSAMLVALGNSMLARREKLKAEVLGKTDTTVRG